MIDPVLFILALVVLLAVGAYFARRQAALRLEIVIEGIYETAAALRDTAKAAAGLDVSMKAFKAAWMDKTVDTTADTEVRVG